MSIEFMSALIGGFVAAAVTMTGWFVTDYLRRRDAMDTRIANFIEQQIMELYAPLYFLAESEYRYRQMRERAISAAPDDKQGAVWWEYSEKFIVPTQLQIYELLKTGNYSGQ
jgi:hypothetical protein